MVEVEYRGVYYKYKWILSEIDVSVTTHQRPRNVHAVICSFFEIRDGFSGLRLHTRSISSTDAVCEITSISGLLEKGTGSELSHLTAVPFAST